MLPPHHTPGLMVCDWCMDHSIWGKVLWRIFMGTWRIRHSKQCWSSQENLYFACKGVQMMWFSTVFPSKLWPGTLAILTMHTHTSVSGSTVHKALKSSPEQRSQKKSFSLLKCPDLFNNILMGYFNSNIYFHYNENVLQVVVQIHWLSWEEITTHWDARAQPLRSRMLARVSPSLLTL